MWSDSTIKVYHQKDSALYSLVMSFSVLSLVSIINFQNKTAERTQISPKKMKILPGLPPNTLSVTIGKRQAIRPQEIQLKETMQGMADGGTTQGRYAQPKGPIVAPQTIINTIIPAKITQEDPSLFPKNPKPVTTLTMAAKRKPVTIKVFLPNLCSWIKEMTVKVRRRALSSSGRTSRISPVKTFFPIDAAYSSMPGAPENCCIMVSRQATSTARGTTYCRIGLSPPFQVISTGFSGYCWLKDETSANFCWQTSQKHSSLQMILMSSSQALFQWLSRWYFGVSQGYTKTNSTICSP